MAVQWYCKIGDQELGPITAELLKQLAEQGQLRPESPIRSGAAGEWLPARRVRGLFHNDSSRESGSTANAGPGQSADSGSKVAAGGASSSRHGSPIKRAKPLVPTHVHDTHPAHDTLTPDTTLNNPALNNPASVSGPAIPVGRPVAANGGPTPPAKPAPLPATTRTSGSKTSSAKPPAAHGPKPPPPRISDSAPVPMGVPVGPAPMMPAPVMPAPEGASGNLSDRSQRLIERRKNSNPLVLVAVLAGVVLVVGLAGGVLLVLRGGRASSQVAETPETPESAGAPSTVDLELDPEDTALEQAPENSATAKPSDPQLKPAAARAATSQPAGVDGTNDGAASGLASPPVSRQVDPTLLAAIKEIRKWADASRVRIRSGSAEVRVVAAWLETESALLGGESGTSDSLVCIQVSVANSSKDNLIDYSSWNGSGILQAEAQAALLGANNVLCPLVPLERTKALEDRQTSVALKPGQTLQDMLVFQAPVGPPEDLRLVLPRSALGSTGHIGFTVPRVMLVSGSRPQRGSQSGEDLAVDAPASPPPAAAGGPAAGASAAVAPADAGAAQPLSAAAGGAASAPVPQPAAPAADSPPTFEDLKRSIEGEPDKKEPPQPGPLVPSQQESPP